MFVHIIVLSEILLFMQEFAVFLLFVHFCQTYKHLNIVLHINIEFVHDNQVLLLYYLLFLMFLQKLTLKLISKEIHFHTL